MQSRRPHRRDRRIPPSGRIGGKMLPNIILSECVQSGANTYDFFVSTVHVSGAGVPTVTPIVSQARALVIPNTFWLVVAGVPEQATSIAIDGAGKITATFATPLAPLQVIITLPIPKGAIPEIGADIAGYSITL